eukprot:168704_1
MLKPLTLLLILFQLQCMIDCIGSDGGLTAAIVGAAIGAGATAVSTGTSVATSASAMTGWSPSMVMEVTNYYNQILGNAQAYNHGGYITDPPFTIFPGYKEAMGGHRVSVTATGTYGTVSWDLGNTGLKAIIMWSVPYDFNYHVNWLAIGIKTNHDENDFDTMYDAYGNGNWFAKDQYYSSSKQIHFEAYGFYITGTMGTDYQPKIQIGIYPSDCNQVTQKFLDVIRAQCPASTWAQVENAKEIGYDHSKKRLVEARAVFSASESGVNGDVIIDENGNVLIDLDVTNLDLAECQFGDNAVSFEYYVYDDWKYDSNDLQSKSGSKACDTDMTGAYYDPFNTGKCADVESVDYFDCAIGDLSGRLGVVVPDDDNKISHTGNVSAKDEKDGFCGKKLTPEQVYKKSVVFYCNDGKETPLFCAPFDINIVQ